MLNRFKILKRSIDIVKIQCVVGCTGFTVGLGYGILNWEKSTPSYIFRPMLFNMGVTIISSLSGLILGFFWPITIPVLGHGVYTYQLNQKYPPKRYNYRLIYYDDPLYFKIKDGECTDIYDDWGE